jgi:DNA polymerase III epsilon subunit-like protein
MVTSNSKIEKQKVIERAQKILSNPKKYLLWDTETTDLSNVAQVIEICAIDCTGTVVVNQRIKPTVSISPQAQAVHHISITDLVDCPTWHDFYRDWEDAIAGKILGAYNAQFDVRMLDQTYAAYELERSKIKGFCAMGMTTSYYGRRQKLGGNHSAIGDCLQMLDLIRVFARHNQPKDDRWTIPGLDELLDEFDLKPKLPFDWP